MIRRNKYNSRRVFYDGHWFDSLREKLRYQELKLMEKAGEIKNLELHDVFAFRMKDQTIFKYISDFAYTQSEKWIVEDVKGVKTAVYRLKKKLIEAQYGIKIIEV